MPVHGKIGNARPDLRYGILRGLQGDALVSRLYLTQALEANPASANAKAALQAVNP